MRWGTLAFTVVAVTASAPFAWADPAPAPPPTDAPALSGPPADASVQPAMFPAPAPVFPPPPIVGYAAMPGGLSVPAAMTLPKGTLELGSLASFGYRKGLLAPDERLFRLSGDIALAYAPTSLLTVALSLDGRYDRHYGLPPAGDDGYVGDPHLFARVAKEFGTARLGAQLGIWVPGKNAPSIAPSAISVDLRVLASVIAGPGTLSIDAGFRLDNSASSIAAADVLKLSPQDQVSLGVSSYNAILGGVSYTVPLADRNKAYLMFEGSLDKFVGSGAPSSPIVRGGVTVGFHLSDAWTGLVFLEGAKDPDILLSQVSSNQIPLLPYEALVTGGIGLQGAFGGPDKPAGKIVPNPHGDAHIVVQKLATIEGVIVDDAGNPVVGAKITITVKDKIGNTVSDDKGAYKIDELPIDNARIDVTVDGKKPGTATVALVEGVNAVAKIALESILPPGELRGLVRALSTGKPVTGATITVTPGGATASVGADGGFTIALPPGQYKISVTAPGLQAQELDVTIDPNGVAIKNIDMHK